MFARATSAAIARHGILSTYKSINTGDYDVDLGTVPTSEATYTFKIYKKQIVANQYFYPNLIGKESGIFYIDASLITFKPKPQDLITYNSKVYKVESVQEFSAAGSVLLYKAIGVA